MVSIFTRHNASPLLLFVGAPPSDHRSLQKFSPCESQIQQGMGHGIWIS
jgi:hypothetical protein